MATSYDTLLKQVETLTAENSSLKKELKDNSNQLCQLETEASSMKDALLQLHYSTQSMQEDIMAAHRTSEVKVTMRGSQSIARVRNVSGLEMNHAPPEGYILLEELEKERFILSQQQENEEKLKAWYMNHLQDLKRRLEELPLSEHQYPMSLARQQIEQEMKQLRDVMQRSLGCPEEVATRQRKRAIRLHSIDQKLKDAYARKQETKTEDKRSSHHGRGHPESRHHHQSGQVVPPSNGHRDPSHAADHTQDPRGRTSSPYRHLSSDGRPPGVQVAWTPGQGGSPPEGRGDQEQETSSLVSFNSSNGSDVQPRKAPAPQFGTKVEMVYSLLSMLGTHDKDDMSRTLLAMSSSQDSCISMRESGCLPLLIQLLHGPEREFLLGQPREGQEARSRASTALHNIVHSHPDEAKRKQESRILRLLEQIRAFCDDLMERNGNDHDQGVADHNPGQAIATLMKHSFDEEYRSAICQLGGIQAIAELLQIDYELNSDSNEQYTVTLRRYAGMAITNLTFGDVTNKALLCSMKGCMRALVAQLQHQNEDLRQVAASVLRNLSWRADMASKRILRDVGAVPALTRCALEVEKESSLKSVLSALWNLSAHCTENKADICAVDGSLGFLVGTLTYKSPTRNWAVVENGGGILRNVSSHVATNEDYRRVLREHNCLQVLLRHLKSSSLTIVSNACGTLWNLSARNKDDQDLLWELGAVAMLKNLVHSKHKMIAMGSSAALRNLMSARPDLLAVEGQREGGQPTLHVRKQRALEAEIDKNLRDSHMEGVGGEDRRRYSYSFPRQQGGGRGGENFPSSRTMPSMPGKLADHSAVPQRIPIWSQNPTMSVPEPEKMSSPLPKRHQVASGQKGNLSSSTILSPGVPYQPYGINLEQQQGQGSPAKKTGDGREVVGGSPRTSRIAKVMQDVQQHSTTSSEGSQGNKASTASHGSPRALAGKEPIKTVPAHCMTKGNHSDLTSRSNSYSFGMEGHHVDDLDHRASQESVHSDIYPSASHERALAWATKDQERTHSDENGLNRGSSVNRKSNLVEHQAVVHQSGAGRVEDMGQEADSIINFSLKYSEEDLQPPQQGVRPLKESQGGSDNKGQSGQSIPQDWCNSNTYEKSGSIKGSPAADNRFKTISTNLPNVHCINFTEDTDDFFRDDKPTNFANRYEEEVEVEEREDSPSDSGEKISSEGGDQKQRVHDDGMKSYYVEDTPVVFSRCSSLSSLEDEENAKGDEGEGTAKRVHQGKNLGGNNRSETPENQPPASHTTHAEPHHHHHHSEEPECHVEDTPLIFSRCSSVSSLSSVEVQDICEDKSSVCSDSRRASEVVSPSDLPDSPSETMPQSPRRTKAPAVPRPVVPTTGQPPAAPNGPVLLPGAEEKAVSYRMVEGKTVDNSCATSLSALTIDDETKVAPVTIMREDTVVDVAKPSMQDEADGELSDGEQSTSLKESEEDILNACINSALPSKKAGKSKSKSKLGHLRKNGRGSLPTLVGREPDGAMDVISAYKTEDTPVNFSTSTSLSDLTIEDIDIVKTDDGGRLRVRNPAVGSRTGDGAKVITPSRAREQETTDKAGDDSLLEACINSAMPKSKTGKGKSGIPKKNRGIPKLKGSSKISGTSRKRNPGVQELRYKSPSPIPEMAHENARTASEIQEEKWPGTVSPAPDTVQTFCVEGTPGLSKASSWGDLTESLVQEDILNGNAPQVQEERRSSFAGAGASVKKPKSNSKGLLGTTASKLSSGSTPMDSPRVYGMEGTPATFSRNDSLSSLSCDEDADLGRAKTDMRKEGDGATSQDLAGMKNIPPASSSQPQSSFYDTPMDSPRVFMVEGTPLSFSRKESLSSISCDEEDHEDHERKETSSKTAKECLAEKTGRESGESPKEKKEPGALGREFLQRQLNSEDPFENFQDDKEEDDDNEIDELDGEGEVFESLAGDPEQEQTKETAQKTQREQIRPFAVEDTPVCFSRNSSLSSLSINSDDEGNEQALLEQCISSGMPQGQKKKEKTFHIESKETGKGEGRALNRTYNKDDLKAARREYQGAEEAHEKEGNESEDKPACRGPRISKPSAGDKKVASDAPKGVRGGKKTYRSPITGQTRTVTQVKTVTRGRGTVVVKSVGRGVSPQGKPTTLAGRGGPSGRGGRGGGAGRGGRTITPPRTVTPPRSASTPPRTATTPPRSTSGSRNGSPGGGVPRLGVKRGSISSVSDTSSNNGTSKTSPGGRSISPAGRGRSTNIKTTPARNFGVSPPKGRGSPAPSWNASTIPMKPPLGRGKKPTNTVSAPGSRTQSPAMGWTKSPTAGKSQIPTGRKNSTTSSPSPTSRTQIPARRGSGSPGVMGRSTSAVKSPQSATARKAASPPSKNSPGGPKKGGIPTLRSQSTPAAGKLSPPKKKSPPVSTRASKSESQGESSPPHSPLGEEKQNNDDDPPKLQKQSTFTKEKPSLPDHTPEMSSNKSVDKKGPGSKAEKLEDILSEAGSDITSHSSGSISNGGWRRTRPGGSATTPLNKSGNNAAKTKTPTTRGAHGGVNGTANGKSTPTGKPGNARTSSAPSRTPQSRRVASPSPKPQGRNGSTPAKPSRQGNNLKASNNNDSRKPSPAPGMRNTSPTVRKASPAAQKVSAKSLQSDTVPTAGGVQLSPVESRVPRGNFDLSSKGQSDLCAEIGIPIRNKKGKVTSPSNDAIRNSGVWVKNDDDGSPSSLSESSVVMSRQSSVASVVKTTTTPQVGRGDSISTRNLPNLDVLMSTRSSSVHEVSSPLEAEGRRAESDKQRAKSLVVDRQNSETSLGGKEEKKKKRFSFLKLKVGKKKKDAGEERVKEPKVQKVKEPKEKSKKKLFKKSKDKTKQTEDSETQTDNEENICADTDDRPESSIADSSQSGTLDNRSSYQGPDLNFDRRLDHLEAGWTSDNDIMNELMPDEFMEWDSEMDISKEEIPVFSETASEADPQSLEYRGASANSTNSYDPLHRAHLNSTRQADAAAQLGGYLSEDALGNQRVRAENRTVAEGLRSLSLSEGGGVSDSQSEPAPPRPQRLRLPKKPFGMNRSDSSPTSTAIPVLVSPFNYSPKKLQLETVEGKVQQGSGSVGSSGAGGLTQDCC